MNDIEVVLRDGGIYIITKEQISYWIYIYPEVDVISEITYLKELWSNNVIPRKTAKNINKYINKHLAKANHDEYL